MSSVVSSYSEISCLELSSSSDDSCLQIACTSAASANSVLEVCLYFFFFFFLHSGQAVPSEFLIPIFLDECSGHLCLLRQVGHPLIYPTMALIIIGIVF